jgi:hypothetical protein
VPGILDRPNKSVDYYRIYQSYRRECDIPATLGAYDCLEGILMLV